MDDLVAHTPLPNTHDKASNVGAAERFWDIGELRQIVYDIISQDMLAYLHEYAGLILASTIIKREVTHTLIKAYNASAAMGLAKYKDANGRILIKVISPVTFPDLRKAHVLLPKSMFTGKTLQEYRADNPGGRFGNNITSRCMPMWYSSVKTLIFSIYDDGADENAEEQGPENLANVSKAFGVIDFTHMINEALAAPKLKATRIELRWGLHLAHPVCQQRLRCALGSGSLWRRKYSRPPHNWTMDDQCYRGAFLGVGWTRRVLKRTRAISE